MQTTADGRQIFTIEVEVFPRFNANVYVINNFGKWFIVDTGSGRDACNQQIEQGLAQIGRQIGRSLSTADLDLILLTHGHIDHFGGLPYLRQQTEAPLAIHALDYRVISYFEERRMLDMRRTLDFATESGMTEAQREQLYQMRQLFRSSYRSMPVQHVLEDGQTFHDLIVHHTPGHSAGQVCYQVDDVLLTADHILHSTTPHQAPERIHNNSGLSHYLESLDKIGRLSPFKIGLGGHEAPIPDVHQRIADIKAFHAKRLDKVRVSCQERPKTISEISLDIFGPREGFHIWLAIEETGAHVEYLFLRGELSAANPEAFEQEGIPVIQYVKN